MNSKRGYNYTVRPENTDYTARASVKWIMDAVLSAARDDADSFGFGTRQLTERHLTWVISRIGMNIFEQPKAYTQLTIYTWISEKGRLRTTRNFEIVDQSGRTLVAAVSNWALIDFISRRPVDIDSIGDYDNFVQQFPLTVEQPARLVSRPDMNVLLNHTALYSDVDFNRHVHSTLYLQWVFDTLPHESIESSAGWRIDINFIREALLGEQLTIKSDCACAPQFDIVTDQGDTVCRIRLSTPQLTTIPPAAIP